METSIENRFSERITRPWNDSRWHVIRFCRDLSHCLSFNVEWMPKTGCKHINAQIEEQHLLQVYGNGSSFMYLTIQSWRAAFAQILIVVEWPDQHLFFSSIPLSCNVKTYLTFFVFGKKGLIEVSWEFFLTSGIISHHLMMWKIWCFDSRLSEKNRFFRCLQGKEMQGKMLLIIYQSNIYSDCTGFLNWKKKLYVRHTCALGIKGTKRRLAVKNFLEIFLRSK